MAKNNVVNLKPCCYLCDDFGERSCDMYNIIEAARKNGNTEYDDTFKFRMVCNNFELNQRLEEEE